MQIEFGEALLRLKQVLGVQADKDVASALGMADRAFAARKLRNSFPEDKLFALAARHPELGIDPAYVLTGKGHAKALLPAGDQAALLVASKRGAYAPPINPRLLTACIELVVAHAAARGLSLAPSAVGVVAGGVYEMSMPTGHVNDKAIEPMLDAYITGRGA